MSKRKISQEEIGRQHIDLAILRAAKETVDEQNRAFQEKRRENNLFFVLDTIHPAYYDVFASKLKIEELEVLLNQLDGLAIGFEFWKKLSDKTIERILSSIWEFHTFLEQVEAETVNAFLNAQACSWCVENFSNFEFPEQLEILSRFSERGMESFFAEILENRILYVSEISYIFQKMEAAKTEKTEMVWEKICELPAAILSELIRLGNAETNDILMRKLSEEKVTAICCETEEENMFQVLEKSAFEMMYHCQKPNIICHKLTDSELQALFTVLQKRETSLFLITSQCLEAFYHAVKAEDKTYILDQILPAKGFGKLYQKLSKEEQDEMFELITSENISSNKRKELCQEAIDFLNTKGKLSYFEKVTLQNLCAIRSQIS